MSFFKRSSGMILLMAVKIYVSGQKKILQFVTFLQNLQIKAFIDAQPEL